MAAAAFEGANDHLLFHAIEIADRHGGRLTLSHRIAGHSILDLRFTNLELARFHRNSSHQVAEFTNIARPRVREQRGDGLRCKRTAGFLEAEKMFRQSDNVFGSLPQRRHTELELPESMKKVLAKAARSYRSVEILIGSRDESHIHRDLAMPAQAVEGVAIEHAQELHLRLKLQFPDFVEKQRALVGQFEQACPGGVGSGKRAFLIAE